jgi:hypothetical protein
MCLRESRETKKQWVRNVRKGTRSVGEGKRSLPGGIQSHTWRYGYCETSTVDAIDLCLLKSMQFSALLARFVKSQVSTFETAEALRRSLVVKALCRRTIPSPRQWRAHGFIPADTYQPRSSFWTRKQFWLSMERGRTYEIRASSRVFH